MSTTVQSLDLLGNGRTQSLKGSTQELPQSTENISENKQTARQLASMAYSVEIPTDPSFIQIGHHVHVKTSDGGYWPKIAPGELMPKGIKA